MPDEFGQLAMIREYGRLSAVDEIFRQDAVKLDNLRRGILDLVKTSEDMATAGSSDMRLVAKHLRAAHHWLLEAQREQAK